MTALVANIISPHEAYYGTTQRGVLAGGEGHFLCGGMCCFGGWRGRGGGGGVVSRGVRAHEQKVSSPPHTPPSPPICFRFLLLLVSAVFASGPALRGRLVCIAVESLVENCPPGKGSFPAAESRCRGPLEIENSHVLPHPAPLSPPLSSPHASHRWTGTRT